MTQPTEAELAAGERRQMAAADAPQFARWEFIRGHIAGAEYEAPIARREALEEARDAVRPFCTDPTAILIHGGGRDFHRWSEGNEIQCHAQSIVQLLEKLP